MKKESEAVRLATITMMPLGRHTTEYAGSDRSGRLWRRRITAAVKIRAGAYLALPADCPGPPRDEPKAVWAMICLAGDRRRHPPAWPIEARGFAARCPRVPTLRRAIDRGGGPQDHSP